MPDHDRPCASLRRFLFLALLALGLAACGGGGSSGSGTTSPPPALLVAPSIATAPQDASVADGATASFSVVASGTGPFTYQWQLNGSNLAGATQASYTTAALTAADVGNKYQVIVAGPGGSITSAAASVNIKFVPITIAQQPASSTLLEGRTASFTVQATGSGPIRYQWLRNGSNLPGATGASYTTAALTVDETGAKYQVELSNPAGVVRSEIAALTVTPAIPVFAIQPTNQTVAERDGVTLTAAATSSVLVSYQWKRNGQNIDGATSATFSFTATMAENGQRFTLVASNVAGSIESQAALISVNPLAASFKLQPQNASLSTGGSATFTARAEASVPLSYQWQRSVDFDRSWQAIAGATETTYRLSNVTLADKSSFVRLAASNGQSTTYSEPALVAVQANVQVITGRLGGAGNADGSSSQVRFAGISALALDPWGNVHVSDGNTIRLYSQDGQVSVYAGKPGISSRRDGRLADATFQGITALACASDGSIYVAEQQTVRKISADGLVTTLAGSDVIGSTDGKGAEASFTLLVGMTLDAGGVLYVTDGHTVRKISADGLVTTIAGRPKEVVVRDGRGTAASFGSPGAIVKGTTGELFVTDGTAIRRIDSSGNVSRYAGEYDVLNAAVDGERLNARFDRPNGLAIDASGRLWVLERSRVVRIDQYGYAQTIAGIGSPYLYGDTPLDGKGDQARFRNANKIIRVGSDSFVIADNGQALRGLTADGTVNTLAGQAVQAGKADGSLAAATFNNPRGLLPMPDGSVLVADTDNSRIRRLGNDGLVSTFAGSDSGNKDGTGTQARFKQPIALTRDASGNVYVADAQAAIRKITPSGVVSTLPGTDKDFPGAKGIAVDSSGAVYALVGCRVIKLTSGGQLSTLAGSSTACGNADGEGAQARFGALEGLVLDGQGRLFVTDGSNAIRRIEPDGRVSTVAGVSDWPGYIDNEVPKARFNGLGSLAIDAHGNLYVADKGNSAIRRITPAGFVHTVVGRYGVQALQPGLDGAINIPYGLAVRPNGRLIFISEQAIASD
ncbi:hypothetical protein [Roseateles microcysteis]|uniref:hypothetical protein n=1 Tax=Roseateles microcysteis TaxID=3119057 RepID=UPI002FE59844